MNKKTKRMNTEDEYSGLERRKLPRIRDNIFIIGDLRSSPGEKFKALTRDISAGGLMFETERDISKDTKVELEICQPMNRDKTMIFCIPVLGKIRRVREIDKDNFEPGENKYKVGVEFSEIKEEDRQKIIKYVEENSS